MRKEDSRDPWLNQSHIPMTDWENELRPSRSSNRMLFLLAAAAAAIATFVAFSGWRDSAALRNQHERQVAPAKPTVEASPAPRSEERELEPAQSPRVQRFTKCISSAGAATYSDGPCPAGTRTGEVSVKPDANLADGMPRAARQASMAQNRAIAQSVYEHERRVSMIVDSSSTECAQLNALIASIDAAARQPQSGFEQDRLKDQRRRARDRQFALHCG